MKEYRGVIIEESLNDNRIINELNVEKMIITGQENPLERWHMYEVSVSLEEIRKLASHILDEWYMHFWKEKEVIALFKEKEFKFNYDDKNSNGNRIETKIHIIESIQLNEINYEENK